MPPEPPPLPPPGDMDWTAAAAAAAADPKPPGLPNRPELKYIRLLLYLKNKIIL